jgi:hypothetical protein
MKNERLQTNDASAYLSGLTDSSVQELNTSNEYYSQHRALIGLASKLQDDPRHDGLVALACATYGWMPTILKSCEPAKFNLGAPITEIRAARTESVASELLNAIDDVAPINKSWVGTSKLLHFLNPDVFPIFDRRVAERFRLKWPEQYNRKPIYLSYFGFVHSEVAKNHSWLSVVAERIELEHGYRPSKVRCLEIMLFERKA